VEDPPSKARIALRLGAFLVVAAFMFMGPAARQLGGSHSKYLRNWVMFSGFAREICAVEYTRHSGDDAVTPINRTQALGYETYLHAPKTVRRLAGIDEVERQGRKICSKLKSTVADGEVLDIRAAATCASRKGWKDTVNTENLCATRSTSFERLREKAEAESKAETNPAPKAGPKAGPKADPKTGADK